MRLFGRKAAPAGARPALVRSMLGTMVSGEWPRGYEAQVREAYLGNAVAQRAGISPQLAMQILMMLAPIVLNYLAKQRSGQAGNVGASTGGMGDIGSILGSILGGGGLGSVLGQVLGGGAQTPSVPSQNDQQPQGSITGGSVIPGYPSGNTGAAAQPSQMGDLGGMIGTLNNVLDRDGDGNALNDLIGMFGGRRA